MDTDTPKISRRLILVFCSLIISAAAYAQTCKPTGTPSTCPTIPGVTCSFAATIEKGCNCYDGVDNDGDGKIDSDDLDCAYYLTTYVGAGSTCSLPPPSSGTTTFTGVTDVASAQQNTADTPAKISVGDIDGDGIPDVCVTSKFNRTIQVVATATNVLGDDAGDIMSDYKTQFGGFTGVNIDNTWAFEHETAIANTTGDKKAEMYTIASKRGGGNSGANDPPTEFALLAFSYVRPGTAKGNLTPMWGVSLGTNRPGSIGLADFNGDGLAEVYIRNQIYAAENGTKLADGGGDWKTAVNTGSVAVDINLDGTLELVCGNFIYTVPSLTGRTLQTLTVFKDMNTDFPATKFYPKGYNDINEYGITQASMTSVADFDVDGYPDVFISGAVNCSGNEASPCGSNPTTVFYWNVHNNTLKTFTPPDGTYALGWVWGTGRINLYDAYPNHEGLEALFMAGKRMFCLDNSTFTTGTPLWVRNTPNDALSGILSLTCYDFNNDGNVEVVYRDTQELAVTDGKTGQSTIWATTCQSHTMTEGPIIADVNGDGATDICIPCYTNTNAFSIASSTPQQQSLGQVHLYYTNSSTWLPTRKVWNQHPYFVVNINDDMTLPKSQIDQSLIFGTGACPNGVNGPQRPLNLFMDQVPHLSASGCPEFPAPDLVFYGDTPNPACSGVTPLPAGCDTNGDGSYSPTVDITPPICGNLDIKAKFNIQNNGDLAISDNVPVSFFWGDPTTALTGTITCTTGSKTVTGSGTSFLTDLAVGSTLVNYATGATIGVVASIASNTSLTLVANGLVAVTGGTYLSAAKLYGTSFTISNLAIGSTYTSPTYSFNGPGTTFRLYTVIYNNGNTLPIVLTGSSAKECTISNNIYSTIISPTPFTVTVEKVQDNLNCPPYNPPNNGQLRTRIYIGGVEVTDYSPYSFQWYTGSTTASPIAGANLYNLSNLDQGTYGVVVTNTQKGCANAIVTGTIARSNPVFPAFTITKVSDQTLCTPANGELIVAPADGSTGYTYTWQDIALNPIGVSGADAKNLLAGNYVVQIQKGTCICKDPVTGGPCASSTVAGPQYPDAQASTLADVVDCLNPNSGSTTANAFIGGVQQPAANYTFNWYFYNNVTSTRGSILPAPNNNLQTTSGLAAGWYQAVITDNTTKCTATTSPTTEVKTSTVTPSAAITELAPQTSCDPNQPNGILTAVGTATGFTSPTDFTFEWFRGDNTLAANKIPIAGGPETVSGSKGEQLNNAKGGGVVYTVRVTTPKNCSATNKLTLNDNPVQPVLVLAQSPNSICDATKTSPSIAYNGSVTATVTFNGVGVTLPDPNYTFNWYDGTTTTTAHTPATSGGPTLAGLKDGDYAATVTRTDLHCTSIVQTKTVLKTTVQPILAPTSTGSNNCDPALTPDGTVTVGVTNPQVPAHNYTYQWYEGNSTVAPSVALGVANNGTSATAIKVGGPFTPNKIYTVYVRDISNGCDNTTSQTVSDVSVIPVLTTSTAPNSICSPATNFNGSMTATVTNIPSGYTVSDYSFTWYDGNTSTTLHNPQPSPVSTVTLPKLDVGTYSVIAKNTKTGCPSSLYTNNVIPAKIFPALQPASTGSNNCDPLLTPDGTASYSVTNTGASPGPFTQQWYVGGGADPIVSGYPTVPASPNNGTSVTAIKLGGPNIPAGSAPRSYTVLVTNTATGCTNYTTASVPDNSIQPVLNTTTTGNGVCDLTLGFQGTMTATVTNIPALYTISDYTFAWYNGNTTASPYTPAPAAGSAVLTGLDSKTFSVIGTNTKTGCVSALATNSVGNTKVYPTLAPSATGSNNCVVGGGITNDGTASVVASGTVGGYSYQWYDGAGDPRLGGGPTIMAGKTSATLTGVGGPIGAPHSYTVLVKDVGTGCDGYVTPVVPDNSVKPILSTGTTPNDICDITKGYAGTMTATVTNIPTGYVIGDYDFTFKSGGGATLQGPGTANVLSSLDAGSYTAEATNRKTGCASLVYPNAVGDTKVYPVVGVSTTGSHNCSNLVTPDGTATATVTPIGADTFLYSWTAVAPAVAINNPVNNANTATAIKLGGPSNAPNSYLITVTDFRTGCVGTNTAQVSDLSQKPTFTLTPFDNTVCTNALGILKNGHVDISAVTHPQLGTSTITYKFFNVDPITSAITTTIRTDANMAQPPTTDVLSNLSAAKYAATVNVDALGCTSDPVIVEVKDLTVTPVPTITANNNTVCTNALAITFNGNASVTSITGGGGSGTLLTNYNYQWYTGAVVDPAQIIVGMTTATGPTQIQGTSSYTVQVTNKTDGCQGSTPTTITDAKVIPTISVTLVQNNTICDLATIDPDGKLLATPSISSNYSIAWSGGAAPAIPGTTTLTGDTYTKLKAGGPYSANVTDTNTGCKSADDSKSIVDALTYPVIAITPTDQTSCDPSKPNGKLAATADGTTDATTYDFVWHDGVGLGGSTHAQTSTGLIDNLAIGSYTILITKKSTGCASTQTPAVSINITYPVLNLTGSAVADCATPDGKVSFSQTGLSNPNLYRLWFLQETGSTTTTNTTTIKTSGTLIQQTADPIPDKTLLAPHYYTALLRDSVTHCQSQPVTVIVAPPSFPAISINSIAAGTSCGVGSTGGIATTVTGGTMPYTFKWYLGAPSNTGITFIPDPPTPANPPNMGGATLLGAQTTQNLTNVGTGQYTFIVTDSKGCGDYNVQTVPSLTAPTIVWTPTDNTKCKVGQENGTVKVDVTGTAGVTYGISLYTGNDPATAVLASGPFNAVATNTHTFTSLKKAEYLVKVDDAASPACPDWHLVQIDQVAYNPVVDIDITSGNTSCNPAASADGAVKVTVSAVANPPNTNFGSENFEITSVTPAPTVAFATPFNLGTGGNTTVSGLKPIAYTILVTDLFTGCETTSVVTMSDNPVTPDVITAGVTDETNCAISSNGSALAAVTGYAAANLTQFNFTWAQNIDLSSPVYTFAGNGAGTQGELLNQTHAIAGTPGNYWPMGAAGSGSGDRTFYLQGTRNAAPGFGCKTPIIQVVIPDKHVAPDMTLTPAFDSFCLATAANNAIGDGKITIVADADPSTGGQDIPAAGFDYSWTPVPAGAVPAPTQNSNAASYVIGQLHDGSYTVTLTNATNKCSTANTVSINPAPYVISVDATDAIINQRICTNDGWVRVSSITLKDNSVGGPNTQTNTNAAIDPLYSFQWYNNALQTAGTELRENGGVTPLIVTRALSNDVNQDLTINQAGDYQAMKAGTYYVIATRSDNTKIGFGCPSLPFRVDVNDTHINPVPAVTTLSNTSCNSTAPGEGEIKINVTDATAAPYNGGTYTYTWNTLPATQVIGTTVANDGDGSGADGDGDNPTLLLDGSYNFTIKNNTTGCSVVSNPTILKNAVPVFVQTVNTTDQIACFAIGDGSLTVAKVSVNDRAGSSTDYVTAPGAGQGNISNFDFDWTRNPIVHTQTTTGAGGNVLNSTTYNAAALPGGFGTPIGAATYTVVATRTTGSPGNGCKSAPFTASIFDKRIYPVVTLTPFSNTSCNTAFEGEIKVKVTDATTYTPVPAGGFKFDYTWTTSPNPIAASLGNNGNEANDGAGPDKDYLTGQQDGGYTVNIANSTTQCAVNSSTTITKNATPVFVQTVDIVDQILCTPDGSLTVSKVTLNDRTGTTTTFTPGGASNLLTDFQFEWQRVGDANAYTEITNGAVPPAGSVLNNTTYVVGAPGSGFAQTFGAATYTVVARRKAGSPGANCASSPYSVVLQDKSIKPVVTLTPFANTSCSVAFEGEITVGITDATTNNVAHTFTPFSYTYNWTASATPGIINGAVAGTHNGNNVGTDGDGDNPKTLSDGSYALTATNTQTGCPSSGSTIIFKNSTPVFTQLVTPTDQVLCAADGKLEIKEIQLIDRTGTVKSNLKPAPDNLSVSDFNFDWQNASGTVIKTTQGVNGAVSGGTILDNNPVTGYATIGAGTYYAVTKRVSGSPGLGCQSAPYKVDILDKRIFPVASLTPLSNTSCDPAFFEGEIKVKVTDASVNLPAPYVAGTPFSYNYNWTTVVTAIVPNPSINNDGDGFGGGENDGSGLDNDNDHPKALKEGTYTVSVTNAQTQCQSTGTTTIFKNGTPVFTQLVVPTAQVICKPDGKLEVKEVKIIDRNGVVQSNLNMPPDFALSDFVFTYDRVIAGVTTNVLTNAASPILNNVNYSNPPLPPGIGFGTYFVTTTRKTGFPGKDCSSAPYRIDIDDQRLFPKVAFTSIANSSCNTAKANGSVVANASEQSGVATDPYTFAWTVNGGALPAPAIQADASPKSTITNAVDGAYIVTATNTTTGCPFNASFNLLLDQTRSTPNIIDVVTVDPVNCNPTAGAEVTKITLGSTFNSSLQPPQIPPNNTVTGVALGPPRFVYTWYEGSITNPPLAPTLPCIGPLPNSCGVATTGLLTGDHFVKVLDTQTDCQSGPKQFVIKPDNIIYPVASITQTVKQISCIATTGTAKLEGSAIETDGTTGNYTFTWYPSLDLTGAPYTAPTAPSTTTNPNVLQNLVVGNYSMKVLNTATSCTASAIFIVPDDSPLFMPAISTGAAPQTFCVGTDGDANVRIILDPAYPLLPYDNTSFRTDLYKGGKPVLTNPPDVASNIPFTITGAFGVLTYDMPNLLSGTYTFKVTDLNTGCVTSDSTVIKLQQTKPVITIVQDNPMTNCDPVIANGQLSATADGGKVQGYTFDWYPGTAVSGSILQTDNKLIGQRSGNYTVRTTVNLTGCFDDKTGKIDDATVTPPTPIAKTLHDQTSCISPNGVVDATVGGITQGYSFQWYNGAYKDKASLPSIVNFKFANYFGRDVGDYTVTATDDVTHCVSLPATTPVVDKRVMPDYKIEGTPSYCIDVGRPRGNGSFTLTSKVDVAFHEILWTLPGTGAYVGMGPYVAELFPGDYHVKVTTVEGCFNERDVKIETEIKPYNLVSSNSDGKNDAFLIDCIGNFPGNNVKIFNRNGTLVYEADGYDNLTVFFRGVGEKGVYLSDKELPEGTYFYIIDKRNGEKPKSGFIELIR